MLFSSPANSRVSSSNVSRQSTQEFPDGSFEYFGSETETPAPLLTVPHVRWLEAYDKVLNQLSEVSIVRDSLGGGGVWFCKRDQNNHPPAHRPPCAVAGGVRQGAQPT